MEFEIVDQDNGKKKAIKVTGPNGDYVKGQQKPERDYNGGNGGRDGYRSNGGRGGYRPNNGYRGRGRGSGGYRGGGRGRGGQRGGQRGGFRSYRPQRQQSVKLTSSQEVYEQIIAEWDPDTICLFEEFRILLLKSDLF